LLLLGADIQSIDEIAASLKEFGSRYTRRLFTSDEVEYCEQNPVTESRCYAERFAAKEAVLKLLDVRGVVPSWKDIEVREDREGRPEIVLHDIATELAHRRGIKGISLDISHARRSAIAVVVGRFTDSD
jgi:holo-[acyl-carrier protein] synthase